MAILAFLSFCRHLLLVLAFSEFGLSLNLYWIDNFFSFCIFFYCNFATHWQQVCASLATFLFSFCKSSQSLRPLSRWRFYLWNLFKVVRESKMTFYNQWVNEKEKRSSGWEKRKRKGSSGWEKRKERDHLVGKKEEEKGSSGWEISSNQRCQWGGYVCPALHLRVCLSESRWCLKEFTNATSLLAFSSVS